MGKHIKCADCRFARQDVNASEYTLKYCGKCEHRNGCEKRKTDILCEMQTLKWAAIECGCRESEYYKALLNVTPHGDMEETITWKGCSFGERGCG